MMRNRKTFIVSLIPVLYWLTVYFLYEREFALYSFLLLFPANALILFSLKSKALPQYWLGILFSYMFLDIVFFQIDFGIFIERWGQINYLWLLPAILLTVSSTVVQCLRWEIILKGVREFSFAQLYPSIMIGHCANHLLPAKAGELIKSYHLGKTYGCNKVSIFSTVVVERIFDGILVLSFLASSLFAFNVWSDDFLAMGVFGGALYGTAVTGIILLYAKEDLLKRLVHKVLPEKLSLLFERLIGGFADGLHILKNIRQLFQVFLYSLAMWLIIAVSILPVLAMFHFSLPFYAIFLILACISLGLSVPSAPGGVGIISFATIFAVTFIMKHAGQEVTDIIYAEIVIFSLLINIVFVLPEIVLGVFFTLKSKMSLSGFLDELFPQNK